jgi:hypothetical protein
MAALSSPAAVAQQSPPDTSYSLPSDAYLDALLAARNWKGLGGALSHPGKSEDVWRRMNWLRTRVENGAGFFLSIIYARDLWGVGNLQKINDPARDLRTSAAVISLYTYELIMIDGSKCEDHTAPENRGIQLFRSQAATFAFLKQQSPDLKSKMVDLAIALEQKTAPLRADDELMCRDGLDQMKAGLDRDLQQGVPTPAGQVGKTVAVAPPPGWTPKFVSPDAYRPMQDKIRAGMRENLLKLVAQPS